MVFLREEGRSVEEWVSCERWSPERVYALSGHCVGSLMKDWAKNVRRRWGEEAEAKIREGLGDWSEQLPSSPHETDWLPIALQIRTFELIAELFLEGELHRLEQPMWEDLMLGSRSSALRLLRLAGPGVLLRQASTFHPKMYSAGRLEVKVGWGSADLHLSGASFFENPTWRVLQLFALRFLVRMTERKEVELLGFPTTEDAFRVRLKWS